MKKLFRLSPIILTICLTFFLVGLCKTNQPIKVDAATVSHKVSIIIPREYQEMGTYSVWIVENVGGDENLVKVPRAANNEYAFETGTVIAIKALPKSFYEVQDIKQHLQSEKVAIDTLRVTVLAKREFVLLFKKSVLDIPTKNISKKISNGKLNVEYDEISLGKEIYVSVELSTLFEIKDFIINGVAVNNSDYIGNVDYQNNFATIHITEDWLAGYGDILDIEVTTQIKQTYFIIALCAIVVLPLSVLFAVQMIIANNRTKKAATASLKGKLANAQRMNTGDFISGIREGTITNVDKKSIKEEISKLKTAAPVKPVATLTAVKPVPVNPAPVIIPDIVGKKILPDRTIVDSNKKIVASLRKDGTIIDTKGNMFATARMTDGAIVDKNGNVIGKVQGDGSISK